MSRRAKSFEVRSGSPERTVAALVAAREQVGTSAAAVVFTAGGLLDQDMRFARRVADERLEMPILVVGGNGVLSERGELEGQTAATGLVWSGDNVELGAIDAHSADQGLALGVAMHALAAVVEDEQRPPARRKLQPGYDRRHPVAVVATAIRHEPPLLENTDADARPGTAIEQHRILARVERTRKLGAGGDGGNGTRSQRRNGATEKNGDY